MKGDPKTNGLGHAEVERDGKQFVVIPGPPIFKLKKAEVQNLSLERTLETTENNPFASCIDDSWRELGASLGGPQATGAQLSLGELLLGEVPAALGSGTASAASTGPGASSSGNVMAAPPSSDNPFGFGFTVMKAPVHPAPVVSQSDDVDDVGGGGKSVRRRGGSGRAGGPLAKRAKVGAEAPGGGGHGAVSVGGVSKPAGPGRPKRDLTKEMSKIVQEFETAEETDSTFFGDNFRTRKRNADRLLTDVEARIKSSDCSADEAQSLALQSKKCSAILHICRYLSTHGAASDGFGQMMDGQIHFLTREPIAELAFPGFLTRQRHEAKIRESSAGVFFTLLGHATLLGAGFAEDSIAQAQQSIIAERIVTLSKKAGGDARSALQLQFPDIDGILSDAAPQVSQQVRLVGRIMHRSSAWSALWDKSIGETLSFAAGLREAVGHANERMLICNSLNMFPNGRLELVETRSLADEAERFAEVGSRILKACDVVALETTEGEVKGREEGVAAKELPNDFCGALIRLVAFLQESPDLSSQHVQGILKDRVVSVADRKLEQLATMMFEKFAAPLFSSKLTVAEWTEAR